MNAEVGKEGYAYRITINYTDNLPENVVEMIKDNTSKDISRTDESYTVGLFNSEASATRLIKSIENLLPDVQITISEIIL